MFRAHSVLASVLLRDALCSPLRRIATNTNRCPATNIGSTTCTSRKHDVLALDFDGEVCASAHESSTTALLTAGSLWPYASNGNEQV